MKDTSDGDGRVAVKDDRDLLETMIDAQKRAGYSLSSHWSSYQTETLAVINAVGMKDFLRIPNSFGGFPMAAIRPASYLHRLNYHLRRKLNQLIGTRAPQYPMVRLRETTWQERLNFAASGFATALLNAQHGDKFRELEDSLAGNPQATFQLFGKWYSFQFLTYFFRAQWLFRNLDIPVGATVVEIGGGYGGFAEVLHKARPDLRIALVDIVPQLYIVEQRMKAIFGGLVVGFRETSNMKAIAIGEMPQGSIAIVSPWDSCKLQGVRLGVNHASMQEMTRSQASRYIAELDLSGMQQFFLINQHDGVLRPVEIAVTSDFLVREFQLRKFEVTAFQGRRGRDLYELDKDYTEEEDFLLLEKIKH